MDVLVLGAEALQNERGEPLVQYALRCPHCGAEQPWNLYAQEDLPESLECPACEDDYDTVSMRNALFSQLPPAPPDR